MSKNFTKRELLVESIRVEQSMLETWRRRSDADHMGEKIAVHEAVISAEQDKIADLRKLFDEAPAHVKNCEKRLAAFKKTLKEEANAPEIKKLTGLVEKLRELQAQLAVNPALANDPDVIAALALLKE